MALRAVGRLVSQRLSRGASRNFRSNAAPSENAPDKFVHRGSSDKVWEELDDLTSDCIRRNNLLEAERNEKASYINMWTVYFSAVLVFVGKSIHNDKGRAHKGSFGFGMPR